MDNSAKKGKLMPETSERAHGGYIEPSIDCVAGSFGSDAEHLAWTALVGFAETGITANQNVVGCFFDKSMENKTVVHMKQYNMTVVRLSRPAGADLHVISCAEPRRHAGALRIDNHRRLLVQQCADDVNGMMAIRTGCRGPVRFISRWS